MVASKVTDPFIRTGARESSSWPGVRSTSRPDTFLHTTSANLEFLLDAKRRTIHFYRWDEKAGLLNGMRYAPNDKRTQGADKETSHEEEYQQFSEDESDGGRKKCRRKE